MSLSDLATRAAGEMSDAVAGIEPAVPGATVDETAQARRTACHGVGCEVLREQLGDEDGAWKRHDDPTRLGRPIRSRSDGFWLVTGSFRQATSSSSPDSASAGPDT